MQTNIHGGGGGKSANKGSSVDAVTYLEHERIEHEQELTRTDCQGKIFNGEKEGISINDGVDMIDNNVKGLRKDDAKFYAIDWNPSVSEQEAIFANCKTDRQREKALQNYICKNFMERYAANFKGYTDRQTGKEKLFHAKDLVYVAAVHHTRRTHGDDPGQWHVHVVISRQTRPVKGEKQYSLSPNQNNRETAKSRRAAVKTAFDRTEFRQSLEQDFDHRYGYARSEEETFTYKRDRKKEADQSAANFFQQDDLSTSEKKKKEISLAELKKYNAMKERVQREADSRAAVRRAEREKARAEREAAQQKERDIARGVVRSVTIGNVLYKFLSLSSTGVHVEVNGRNMFYRTEKDIRYMSYEDKKREFVKAVRAAQERQRQEELNERRPRRRGRGMK